MSWVMEKIEMRARLIEVGRFSLSLCSVSQEMVPSPLWRCR